VPHLSRGSKGGIPQPAPRWDFGVHRCRTHVSQSARLCSNGAEGRLCPGLGWATEPFLNPHLSTGAPPFTGFERWISTTHPSLGFRCPRMPCPCLQKRKTPALSLPKVTRGEATPTPRRNRRASYSKPGRVGILIFVFFSVPTDGPFKPVFGLEWGSSLVNPPRNLNSHFGKLGLHNFPGRSHR